MPEHNPPALSAIFITPCGYDTIRKIVRAWARQTIATSVEAVFVCRDAATLDIDAETTSTFHSHQIVEVKGPWSPEGLRARGVLAARGACVAITEDHCFPGPRFAEECVGAIEEGYDAVAGVFRNANPVSAWSAADFLIGYGDWAAPLRDPEPRHLPGHNSVYRREALLEYADELDQRLGCEFILHWDMARRHGSRFRILPSVVQSHTNFARGPSAITIMFIAGWLSGYERARPWGLLHRLLFAAAFPLIPIVRYRRIAFRDGSNGATERDGRSVKAAVLAVLLFDAIGQAIGTLGLQSKVAHRIYADWEFHRERFSRPSRRRSKPARGRDSEESRTTGAPLRRPRPAP